MMKYDPELAARHELLIRTAALAIPSTQMGDLVPALSNFDVLPVGSMVINGAGNDYDYCLLLPSADVESLAHLVDFGFEQTTTEGYNEDKFTTFRKDEINLIVTSDEDLFRTFGRATRVCKFVAELLDKASGELDKPARCRIHDIIQFDKP